MVSDFFKNLTNFFRFFWGINLVEDRERNDGSDGRPFFMSKRLMQILVLDNVDEPNDLLSNDTNYHYNNY